MPAGSGEYRPTAGYGDSSHHQSSPGGRGGSLFHVDGRGVMSQCTDAAAELLGFARGELDGTSISELFYDENAAAAFLETLPDTRSLPQPLHGQFTLKCKHGNPIRLSYTVKPRLQSREEGYTIFASLPHLATEEHDEPASLSQVDLKNPSPVLRISASGEVLSANPGSWLVLREWEVTVGATIPEPWKRLVQSVLADDETKEATLTVGFVSILLVFVPGQKHDHVNVYGIDVTHHRQMEQKVALNARVFENATEAIVITDTDLRIVDVNPAYTAITGYTPEEVLGETMSFLQSEGSEHDGQDEIWSAIHAAGSWQGEVWDRRKNGELYARWLSIAAVTADGGKVSHYIGMFADITRQKVAEEQLYRMAHYDSLTRLANRRLFQDRMGQAMATAGRSGEKFCLLLIDLDGFKMVNDQLGHRAGDHLLRIIADRISSSVRTGDTVSRLGGDEFTVLIRNLTVPEHASSVARNILARIAEPSEIDGQEIFITGSIGIAVYPADGCDTETLLRNADSAMYRSKQSGKNGVQFYSEEMNAHGRERLLYQSRLRRGLDANEVLLYYQPLLEAATGKIIGVEALARWHSAELGMIAPDFFVPVAEEAGLISRLGELILQNACLQAVAWQKKHLPDIRVGVNISARQLRREDFTEVVERTLVESGLDASRLDLELTETVFISDAPEIITTLKRLRNLGVSFTIDDFGTKYASLAYLKRLPVDRIKIDQSFVRDVPQDTGAVEIASAIIAMGLSLKLDVVAEGVERVEQLKFLVERGCQFVQGYYCSPAVPSDRMTVMLQEGGCPGTFASNAV